jgi:hypothetical protein
MDPPRTFWDIPPSGSLPNGVDSRMATYKRVIFVGYGVGVLLVLGAIVVSGCRNLDSRESGFRDNEPVWNSKSDKSTTAGEAAGLSRKAREVERNLGID